MTRFFSVLVLSCCALQAAAPSVEAAKQILEAKWMKLQPEGFEERQVLFQSVRYTSSTGDHHSYEVSVLIRDYDAGYAKNRYFGQTCVRRGDKLTYVIAPA